MRVSCGGVQRDRRGALTFALGEQAVKDDVEQSRGLFGEGSRAARHVIAEDRAVKQIAEHLPDMIDGQLAQSAARSSR